MCDAGLPAGHGVGAAGGVVAPSPSADGVSRRFRSGTEATLRRNLELTEIVEGQLRRGCLTEFLVPREIPQHTEAYALTRRGPQRLLDLPKVGPDVACVGQTQERRENRRKPPHRACDVD